MKICAIGSIEGHKPEIPKCDLLLISGNIFPSGVTNNPKLSFKWFKDEFIEWCESLPVDNIVFIAGVKDWVFEKKSVKIREFIKSYDWLHYLQNEYKEIEINGQTVSIFGTPYTRRTGHWAFMRDDKELERLLNACPPHVDILLTHDAPYGITDIPFERLAFMSNHEDIHQGSKPLRDLYNRTIFSFGFHSNLKSANRNLTKFKDAKICNVSYLNEELKPVEDFEPTLVMNI